MRCHRKEEPRSLNGAKPRGRPDTCILSDGGTGFGDLSIAQTTEWRSPHLRDVFLRHLIRRLGATLPARKLFLLTRTSHEEFHDSKSLEANRDRCSEKLHAGTPFIGSKTMVHRPSPCGRETVKHAWGTRRLHLRQTLGMASHFSAITSTWPYQDNKPGATEPQVRE